MAKWTVQGGGGPIVIEAAGDRVILSIPQGQPIATTVEVAQDIRAKIAMAIAVARSSQQDTQP